MENSGQDFRDGINPDDAVSSIRNDSDIDCVDLFAGAGGFSLAARNIGWNVLAAVEIDRHSAETYRHNFKRNEGAGTVAPHLFESDILTLHPGQVIEAVPSLSGGCDVVLGGPPCQGFSTHRILDSGVEDPRNRLIIRYFQYVAALKPRYFLMENVPGMLWPRHKKFLDAFYNIALRSDYEVLEPVVVDARDFGVPQRRKRVFILGVRKGCPLPEQWPPAATHGNAKACERNPSLKPWVPASIVFDKAILPDDENNTHMNHGPELIEVFKRTPLNGGGRADSGRTLPCHEGYEGHNDVYGRIDPRRPGPTMTTACVNPSKGRFVHPTEHHGITVRHAARFQTFPDTFVFKGGLMAGGAQVGNAVPVMLAEALLECLQTLIVRSAKQ